MKYLEQLKILKFNILKIAIGLFQSEIFFDSKKISDWNNPIFEQSSSQSQKTTTTY